jgi:exopolysaccharide production protein ExoQ
MSPSRSRTIFVAVGLAVFTNGPVFFVTDHVLGGDIGWEQPFTRQLYIAAALVAVTTVALDRFRLSGERLAPPSPVAAVAVIVFTGWAVLSSLWSLAPDLTRGRSLIYVGLAAFAWIVADLEFGRFRAALALSMGACVVASLAIVVASQSIGTDRNDDWRGIYTNRNSLAPVAGLAIIAGLSLLADATRRRRLVTALLPLVGAVVMLGSGSRTAWLALALAIGVALTVVWGRIGHHRYGSKAVTGAGAVLLTAVLGSVAIVSRMWGESTFEQRRTIWDLVLDQIGERPIHGHGWFSIWTVPSFTSTDPLLGRGSAHGSFLEVWLGLGLVGLVPFLVIVGLALHGAIRSAWREPGVASWTWLAVVLFLVIENVTESFVLWFSYNWVLLMAAALRSGVGSPRPTGSRKPVPSEAVSG